MIKKVKSDSFWFHDDVAGVGHMTNVPPAQLTSTGFHSASQSTLTSPQPVGLAQTGRQVRGGGAWCLAEGYLVVVQVVGQPSDEQLVGGVRDHGGDHAC